MFMRIFRYRVRPEMKDRHLIIQARASKLYSKYVEHPPIYYNSSVDPFVWIELHRYADRETCRQAANIVAEDAELARLWAEFQDCFDSGFAPLLEEFDEVELPAPISAPPYAQPPIDVSNSKVDVSNSKVDVSNSKVDVSNSKVDVSNLKADVSNLKAGDGPNGDSRSPADATTAAVPPTPTPANVPQPPMPYVADSPIENNPAAPSDNGPIEDDSDIAEGAIEISDEEDFGAQDASLPERDKYRLE